MDRDHFETQSGGIRLPEGHEEGDLSVRGVVMFLAFLAIGGIVAFVLMIAMIHIMENYEKKAEAQLTPVEQELQKQREMPQEGLGKEQPAGEQEIKPTPDWYGRGKMEDHLTRTFKGPRLQYNDEHDMSLFAGSEQQWLKSTGKDRNGNIHIPVDQAIQIIAQQGFKPVSGSFLPANVGAPSAAYPTGASETGQAPRSSGNTGGGKK